MIANILLGAFHGFILLLIGLLPPYIGLPSGVEIALANVGTYLQKANSIFPIDQLISAVGIIFSFETALLLFKFLNFIMKKIRGSG